MKMLPFAAVLLFVGSASATSLNVPQIEVNRTITADYRYPGGQRFRVTYLNASNGQSFAVLPYRGNPMLLVSTTAADGAACQADSLTWRIKGRDATLVDVRVDAGKPVLEGCTTD
jgi:membrane-bound inhibitor of C-type lysozyme